jgi:hypothetical protein
VQQNVGAMHVKPDIPAHPREEDLVLDPMRGNKVSAFIHLEPGPKHDEPGIGVVKAISRGDLCPKLGALYGVKPKDPEHRFRAAR